MFANKELIQLDTSGTLAFLSVVSARMIHIHEQETQQMRGMATSNHHSAISQCVDTVWSL